MSNEPTRSEYFNTVDAIAEDIRKEYPDADKDHNERCDAVHESVDGSEWIIYTYRVEKVLEYSKNEPDGEEVRSMSGPDADWRKQQQIAAYMAMEQDVYEAIREQDEAAAEKALEDAAESKGE